MAMTTRDLLLAGFVWVNAAMVAGPAAAQEQDGQLWLEAKTNLPLTRDVRATFDQVGRFGPRQDGFYQGEIGGVLSFRVAKDTDLGFGYRKVASFNGGSGPDENRLRQEIVAKSGPVTTRFRVEERFVAGGGGIGIRVRPLIRYNHPLGGRGVAVFVSHESFVLANDTRWGQRSGYDRMRNMVGLTLPLRREVTMEAGYLNQYRPARSGERAEIDHALSLELTIAFGGVSVPMMHD